MDSLFWNSEAELGHPELDRQHFSLAEVLVLLARESRNDVDQAKTWTRFLTEVEDHFRWEESEMEAKGYPELKRHRQDHQVQLFTLAEHAETLRRGQALPSSAFEAMARWNLRHIQGRDRDFAEFLAEHEVWQLRQELNDWEVEAFAHDFAEEAF